MYGTPRVPGFSAAPFIFVSKPRMRSNTVDNLLMPQRHFSTTLLCSANWFHPPSILITISQEFPLAFSTALQYIHCIIQDSTFKIWIMRHIRISLSNIIHKKLIYSTELQDINTTLHYPMQMRLQAGSIPAGELKKEHKMDKHHSDIIFKEYSKCDVNGLYIFCCCVLWKLTFT